jgi:hypothetical protein
MNVFRTIRKNRLLSPQGIANNGFFNLHTLPSAALELADDDGVRG